jgi:hypothetical protein
MPDIWSDCVPGSDKTPCDREYEEIACGFFTKYECTKRECRESWLRALNEAGGGPEPEGMERLALEARGWGG